MNEQEYNKFRQQLLESTNWPSLYMFKFIVPNKDEKLNAVKNLFPKETDFSYKTSKDLRFIGVTVKQTMKTPDDILEIYIRAKGIQGVIML